MKRLALVITVYAVLGFDVATVSAQTPLATGDASNRAALLDSLILTRARWEAVRPADYRVRVDFKCECARPRDNAPWVLVRGDSILRDSVRVDQRPLVDNRPEYYTVNGLFSTLEAAVRDTRVDVTAVRFDATYGIPLSFNTRVRCVVGPCSTGGWTDVRVLGFEVVPDIPASR